MKMWFSPPMCKSFNIQIDYQLACETREKCQPFYNGETSQGYRRPEDRDGEDGRMACKYHGQRLTVYLVRQRRSWAKGLRRAQVGTRPQVGATT